MYLLSLLGLAGLAFAASTPVEKRQAPSGVPDYVLTYAPIVYLHSEDPYFPSDIGNQINNTQPELNTTVITGLPDPLDLNSLNALTSLGNASIYLTSKDDVTDNPPWLNGVAPNSDGETEGAASSAIIVNDHGGGVVDAFYMYFYAFNWGGKYVGFTIGDHVGDWEHNMIRFFNGTPQAVWYSQHSNGEAFTYDTLDKYTGGLRPIVFSANGSHANYAINGTHDHTIPDVNLPEGPLEDHTDYGPVWDPTLSAYYYSYNPVDLTFTAYDDSTPVNWLYFWGKWGDKAYSDDDSRQSCVLGISALCKYTSGPTGPIDKQLTRADICPDNGIACIIRTELGP